jgi:hypothetical protein
MNRPETMKILAILASVWSSEPIDDAKITAYQWALADVPYRAVEVAAGKLLRTAKFFPKPAEIMELIVDDLPMVAPGEAWETVQRQIRKHGYKGWDQVQFGDEAISAAVSSVGWRRMCLDDDQRYIRRDFDAALEAAQQRVRKVIQCGEGSLPGGSIIQLPKRGVRLDRRYLDAIAGNRYQSLTPDERLANRSHPRRAHTATSPAR